MLAAHHGSRKVMYAPDEDGNEEKKQDILDYFTESAGENGYVVISSRKFRDIDPESANPPHLDAREAYDAVAPSEVLCTGEYPYEDAPRPIVFGLVEGIGLDLLDLDEDTADEARNATESGSGGALLLSWLEQASAGQLDPIGQPIHPPVAYQVTFSPSSITVLADAPRPSGEPWLGCAFLRRRGPRRWEVVGWAAASQDWSAQASATQEDGSRLLVAPVRLLPGQIGVEYPMSGRQLLSELDRQNTSSAGLLTLMGKALRLNMILHTGTQTPPLFALLGAPGLGVSGQELATHVVGWEVSTDADAGPLLTVLPDGIAPSAESASEEQQLARDRVQTWLAGAELHWVRMHEMRPEATVRRDQDSPAALLHGRRVLVLGAGALGAPVAEACVRAGAAEVAIVDKALVNPGILVRQPYVDDDIDEAKAAVTAQRLSEIYPQTPVSPAVADAVDIVTDASQLEKFDLVIDATADRIVRHVIEAQRREHGLTWPDLITLMIGPTAQRGIAATNPAGSRSGAVDLLRRLSLRARQSPDLADVVTDFYPSRQDWELFQPAPGCSDATFVGSFADVTGLAGQLLTAGLAGWPDRSRRRPHLLPGCPARAAGPTESSGPMTGSSTIRPAGSRSACPATRSVNFMLRRDATRRPRPGPAGGDRRHAVRHLRPGRRNSLDRRRLRPGTGLGPE